MSNNKKYISEKDPRSLGFYPSEERKGKVMYGNDKNLWKINVTQRGIKKWKQIKLENWMSHLNNKVKIKDLNIPGTHDSGTFDPNSYFNFITKRFSTCQDMTILEQLKIGIRFLDIRLRNVNDTLKVFHGVVEENLNFKEILETLKKFLTSNKTEFVFLRVEKIGGDRNFEELFYQLLKKFDKIICNPKNTNSTISKARGKVIFLQTKSISKNNISFGIPYNYFSRQDFYDLNSREKSIDWKFKKILNHYKKCSKKENEKPCLNYTSGSISNTRDILKSLFFSKSALTPKNIASEINKRNIEYLNSLEKKEYIGFIIADFPTEELTKSIIRLNLDI